MAIIYEFFSFIQIYDSLYHLHERKIGALDGGIEEIHIIIYILERIK